MSFAYNLRRKASQEPREERAERRDLRAAAAPLVRRPATKGKTRPGRGRMKLRGKRGIFPYVKPNNWLTKGPADYRRRREQAAAQVTP